MTWQGWLRPALGPSALTIQAERDRLTRSPQNQPSTGHINGPHRPTGRQQTGAAATHITDPQAAAVAAKLNQRLGLVATADDPLKPKPLGHGGGQGGPTRATRRLSS